MHSLGQCYSNFLIECTGSVLSVIRRTNHVFQTEKIEKTKRYLINNNHTKKQSKKCFYVNPSNARYGLASFPIGYPIVVQWKTVLLEEEDGY